MFENKRYSQINVINDKSQGSVATHMMCSDIFNRHIFTNLLLSPPVKKTFKTGEHWQNCRQEDGLTVTALRTLCAWLQRCRMNNSSDISSSL